MTAPRERLIIGCGYVGRRAARKWIERGDSVFALTRTHDHAQQLRDIGVQPVIGDVMDSASLLSLPAVETVLYAVGYDRASARSMRDVYLGGLQNVLDCLSPSVKRFVYVSSTSVYGQQAGEWVDESSPCEPATDNGRICLAAEELVRQTFSSSAVPEGRGSNRAVSNVPAARQEPPPPEQRAVILRLAGIYGPGRLIARLEALQRGDVLPGNPDAWLNLIHVDDAVVAILTAADRGVLGETYLVCDNEPPSRRDYYSQLAALVGVPAPNMAAVNDGQPAERNKRCSNRKLRQELGVELLFPTIRTGLPQAVTTDVPAVPS